MKKGLLAFAVMICVCLTSWAQDMGKDLNRLPQAAQTFLRDHFSDGIVSKVEMDHDDHSYEVKLKGGSIIEFDASGNWKEVECKGNAVPSAIVPTGITAYVNANYSGQTIRKIEKNSWGYDVDLHNGTSLEFNTKGEFLRID